MEVEIKKHLKKNFKLERKGLKLERQFENKEGSKGKEEKMCLFYASDYHFEMIGIPYIAREIREGHQVVILTENDLNDTVKKILSIIKINEEEKKKIFEINWSKDIKNKLSKIEKLKNQNITVFIKGGKNYIQKIESSLKDINVSNMKIVYCYPVEEVINDMPVIAKSCKKVLTTKSFV